jgi:hypothetical protein
VRPPFRLASLICVCALVAAAPARAEILVTPFLGKTFAAETTVQPTGSITSRKWLFGGSAAWLGAGVLGAEVDVGYVLRFFDSSPLSVPGEVVSGNVTTLSGNVIFAVPLSVTRESLRPYLVAGLGVMHAGADDIGNALSPVDSNLMAVTLGGGAIGFLTPRTGLRFDLRQVRSTSSGVDTTIGARQAQLGFWRATVGVVVRY